jgi:hypothetical protein
MFAYFRSDKTDRAVFVHVTYNADDKVLGVYYFKNWLKTDPQAAIEITQCITNTKAAHIKSREKHVKDKATGYKRSGKIFLNRQILDRLLGAEYMSSMSCIVKASIDVNISVRNKYLEIRLMLSPPNTTLLNFAKHPAFSSDPDRESVNPDLCFFDFDCLTSESSFNHMLNLETEHAVKTRQQDLQPSTTENV